MSPDEAEKRSKMISKRQYKQLVKKRGTKLSSLGWNAFTELSQEKILETTQKVFSKRTGKSPDQVFTNNQYIVQVFNLETSWGFLQKAMIRRNDDRPIHDWQVLQRIKNEIFGTEKTALEVYPKESKLIDMAHLYWLWVLPDGFDCPIEMGREKE